MKIQERYLWIAGVILAGFVIQGQLKKSSDLETLLSTYQLESNIQDAQISDFGEQLSAAKDAHYQRGFEDGRTQAASVLAEAGSIYNYADGYHAAIEQNSLFLISEEEKLFRELEEDIREMIKKDPPEEAPTPDTPEVVDTLEAQ